MDRIESIRRQAKGGGKRITERGISKKDIGEEAFSSMERRRMCGKSTS